MKRDRFFYLWLVLLIVGMICSCVLLGGRIRSEGRDDSVASAVYFDDVIQLAEQSGQTVNDWLGLFAENGVRYVVFDTQPTETERKLLSGFDLSPAGYIGEGSAFALPEHVWSSDSNLPLALIENITRTSVHRPDGFDLSSYDGAMVKAFYLYDEYAARFSADGSGQEIENMLFRAAVDRGMRLILLRPFVDADRTVVTDSAVYAKVLSGLGQRIEARGLEYGEGFSCMETAALRPVLLVGSGCLTAALWILLVTRLKCLRRWGFVLCLLALVGLVLGCLCMPGLMQKGLMLLCAAVFPCLAVYGLWQWRSNPRERCLPDWLEYLAALCILLVWSVLGGLAVGALMSERSYLMGDLIFSGVKAAQAVPLLFCLILFGAPAGKEFAHGPLTKKKVLTLVGVAGVLIAAGAVLVLRSGDFGRISAVEVAFRNALEYAFYARPRTKELLIAVPFMAVGFAAVGKRNSLLALLSGLCCCLESTSVVNTFCHAVAPIHVSLIRSALGAGIGCLVGLVLLFLCRLVFRSADKNAGNAQL